MKKQVTRKYLKALYGNKSIHLGYCQAQNLFPEHQADYYTCGLYGWNFDGFDVNGYLITTGYRYMFGIMPNYEFVKEYDKKAENLHKEYFLKDQNEKRTKLYELQKEFINKVFNK